MKMIFYRLEHYSMKYFNKTILINEMKNSNVLRSHIVACLRVFLSSLTEMIEHLPHPPLSHAVLHHLFHSHSLADRRFIFCEGKKEERERERGREREREGERVIEEEGE